MTFYQFDFIKNTQGALVDVKDTKGRLFSYFILNEGGNKFLKYTKPYGEAQEEITLDNLRFADYLPLNIGIPVFSKRVIEVLKKEVINEIYSYECVVNCEGQEHTFYMCFINKYLDLIDIEKSDFSVLSDGSPILSKAIYKKDNQSDFYLARDKQFKTRLVASKKFVDFCLLNKFNIDFIPVT